MDITKEIFSPILSSLITTGILGFIFLKRDERIKKSIEEEFKKRDKFYDNQFHFKVRALEELLAPIHLQLIRSKNTVANYDKHNVYREEILKDCNENIMKLLLGKGYLIPSDLMSFAEKFIVHYDKWLQKYRETRGENYDKSVAHVFTFDFPKDAEKAFGDKYNYYLNELKIETSLI